MQTLLVLGETALAIIFLIGAFSSPPWLAILLVGMAILTAYAAWIMAGIRKEEL